MGSGGKSTPGSQKNGKRMACKATRKWRDLHKESHTYVPMTFVTICQMFEMV